MRYKSKQSIYKTLYKIYKNRNFRLERYRKDLERQYGKLKHEFYKNEYDFKQKNIVIDKKVKASKLDIKKTRISTLTYISIISIVVALVICINKIKTYDIIQAISFSTLIYFLAFLCLWGSFHLCRVLVNYIMEYTKYNDDEDLDGYHLTRLISLLLSPVVVIMIIVLFNISSKS